MFKPFSLTLAFFFLFTAIFPAGAIAAEGPNPTKPEKPSIVLLPITGQGFSNMELSLYRDTLAESFGEIYDVKYGEQTDRIIEEIFKSHSAEALECDESKCYRDVAAALNTSLIGKATIIMSGTDYRISVVVYDVYENKAIMSRTATCSKCDAGQFEAKLKETAGGKAGGKLVEKAPEKVAEKIPEKTPEKATEKTGVRWYWWVLGLLAAGGAAAASGGSKSGGTPSGNTGSGAGAYTVQW